MALSLLMSHRGFNDVGLLGEKCLDFDFIVCKKFQLNEGIGGSSKPAIKWVRVFN